MRNAIPVIAFEGGVVTGTRPRLFDVVLRVPIARGFCQPVDSALNLFKPKKERLIENR